VPEDKLIEPVVDTTSSRVKGPHVQFIQDTTSFLDDGLGNILVAMRQ